LDTHREDEMTSGPDEFSTAETLANERPGHRFPRSLLLVAATALVLAAGAGVATAAGQTPTPSPSASPSATPSDNGPGWGHRMGFGGRSIHGEFVAPDGEGKYVTIATQYGDVTAVDQDSITVKSEDGYTKEYVVNADTKVNRDGAGIDAVKTGQKVMITAKVDAGTATATTIHDATTADNATTGRDWQGWRGRGGHWRGDHQPSSTPTPSATPTTTS
jgi:hypothetical protein